MTRRVALPSEATIRAAVLELSQESVKGPTVSSVAMKVGLTNPTFWRHFPEAARDIVSERRHREGAEEAAANDRSTNKDAPARDEAAALRSQLEVAVAHIQRLSIENAELRNALNDASKIHPLPRRPRRS